MIYANLILILFLMVFSAFFSGSETGVYRLSRVRVRIGRDKGKRSFQYLFKLLRDGQGLIFTLLLGNNLVNYCLTSVVTITILTKIEDSHMAEIYATAILTPTLFVFAELIPKNILYYQADLLMPRFVWVIWGFDKLFTYSGAKFILKKISACLSALLGLNVDTTQALNVTKRHMVHQIIHETREEGLLTQSQKDMMTRLIDFPLVPVSSIMISLEDVDSVSADTSRDHFVSHLKTSRYTRQIVYGDHPEDILGYVSVYDVLGDKNSFGTVRDHMHPLLTIKKEASVIKAINRLREQRERIALVVTSSRRKSRPVGMITISDLVEEITGELEA